jgi:hypothetical protein
VPVTVVASDALGCTRVAFQAISMRDRRRSLSLVSAYHSRVSPSGVTLLRDLLRGLQSAFGSVSHGMHGLHGSRPLWSLRLMAVVAWWPQATECGLLRNELSDDDLDPGNT